MKHGKRPTREQKNALQRVGLGPEDWLISKNTTYHFVVVNRHTGQHRTILKSCGSAPPHDRGITDPILTYGSTKEEIEKAMREIKNHSSLKSQCVTVQSIKNGDESTSSNTYYEEIIQGQRRPQDIAEAVIARTSQNAGMVLAFIGIDHPAFKLVFNHFVAHDYPDLKKRLFLPLKYLSADKAHKSLDTIIQEMQKN